MATIKELDERLDALKKKNREEEQALRKAIRKQKAQEDLKLTKEVGKLARDYFPQCKSIDAFTALFEILTNTK